VMLKHATTSSASLLEDDVMKKWFEIKIVLILEYDIFYSTSLYNFCNIFYHI
jgi:hypothetical protein